MLGGRIVCPLLPQLQLLRWRHLLQLQKAFSQKSDASCGPGKSKEKPKEQQKAAGCAGDAKPKACSTRLDRRRKHIQEMQKKKAKKEAPKPLNYCAKLKEEKASKESSCGEKEPKASNESSCGKTESKASKESSCGKDEEQNPARQDPCAVHKKAKDSQGPVCETAVANQQQQQQPKCEIVERAAAPSNEIRQPVDWNAMESLLSCMISGVKVACVTHEQMKIFKKLLAARDQRLDDEEASQNIKCAANAVMTMNDPDVEKKDKEPRQEDHED